MKKDFLAIIMLAMLFALSLLTSCGEDKDSIPTNHVTEETITVEKIFSETGCKPTDVKTITTLHLYKNKDSTKYI